MFRRRIAGLLFTVLLLTSFVTPAMAQDDNPTPGTGTSSLFVPFVQKTEVKQVPFSIPAIAMVYGPGGPVTSADTNGTFCPEILGEVTSASSDGYCVGGSQYPGFFNKGSQLTGLYQKGAKVVGGVGVAQPYQLPVRNASFNLNGVKLDTNVSVFGTNEDLTVFTFDPGTGGLPTNQVSASSTNKMNDNVVFLLKMSRITKDRAHLFGAPIPSSMPVFTRISKIPTNLGARCAYQMEGQWYWMWYPDFMDVGASYDSMIFGGTWGPNSNPLDLNSVGVCMGPYRYLSGPKILTAPELEPFRQQVLADQEISTEDVSSYAIPQWGDTELNGTWIVTYAAAAGGAGYIFLQYVANGVVTFASAMIVVPTKVLKCAVQGTIENCWIDEVAAAAVSKPK